MGRSRMVAEAGKVTPIPATQITLLVLGKSLLTHSLCQWLLLKPVEFHLVSVRFVRPQCFLEAFTDQAPKGVSNLAAHGVCDCTMEL